MDIHHAETWSFINSFAPWSSSIGTILAVVVSLYLARKGNSIDLEVKACQGTLVFEGTSNSQDCVWVEVTNVARRSAIVNLVYWKTGVIKKSKFFWKVPINPRSSSFPIQLFDGQHSRWVMEIKDFSHVFEPIIETLKFPWLGPVLVYFIKIGVRTSTGEFFEKRIQKSLRDYLLTLIKPNNTQRKQTRVI